MASFPLPSRSSPGLTFNEGLFFFVLACFLAVACVWPILCWRIHHFSKYLPDAEHFYAVRDHGGTIYLTPALGKFYASLPWLWCTLLAATVVTGMMSDRKSRGAK
jgi:hypothetical protein